MKTIATTFDRSTGRFTLAEPIPRNAVQIVYGETVTTVYEPGDKLPEVPVEPERKELSLDEKIAQLAAVLEYEFVEGDNPDTPEVEKGWWRKVLNAVGIGR